MATLGSYAKRQSQASSAADSTMQALMMLMQHQQQSEDRRLSRKQMQLQNEQLRNLLEVQKRDELESQPRVSTVRTLEQVFTQGDYAALEEVLKSSELYMQNPEVVFGENSVTDVPSAFVRGLGEDPSTQDYATLSTELTNRYERLEGFVRSTEIPKEEQNDFLNGMKDRINALMETPEGEKFKKGIISKTIQRGIGKGSMRIQDTTSEDYMRGLLKADPLHGDVDFNGTLGFITDIAQGAIQQSRIPTIQSLQNTAKGIDDEDMQEAAKTVLEDPKLLNEILASPNPRSEFLNKVQNMPEKEPGFFSKTGELLSDAGGVVADNPGTTFLTGYGGYKALEKLRPLWPFIKPFAAPLAKVLGGAEAVGRAGQEQGLLPREGVFFGENSMLQGSLSDIGLAQELQQRLPEDQRFGVFMGLLQGMGNEISDLFSSNQKNGTYVPIPRQQPQPLQGPENQPLYGPENQPLYGPENQPLYGPENQPLYGPETQPPLQGPLTQDQAQLQALADKIENAVAQDQAQQQALIDAGIFPMAGVSSVDNLLEGPENQPLYGPENPFLNVPSEDLLSAIQNIYPNSSLNSDDVKDLKIQSPIPTLFDLMQDKQLARADAPVEEMTEEKKRQLLELAYPMDYLQKMAMGDSPAPPQQQPPPLYGPENQPLYGPENQPLYGPETQPPPLYGPETQPPLYGPETQPLYGPPAPTPLQQETQMGAEEYLRALYIRQAQQQEMQQALLGLMQQPF